MYRFRAWEQVPVEVFDAAGQKKSTRIDAQGCYEVDVAGLDAPLRVVAGSGSRQLVALLAALPGAGADPVAHGSPLTDKIASDVAVALQPPLGGALDLAEAGKTQFDAGRLAVLQNVGTLIERVSKAQYSQGRGKVCLPPKLFSHSDQQSFWQASAAEGATVGWSGRLGDLFAAGNGRATFSGVSVAGNAVFLSGKAAVQYQVTPTGSVTVNGIKAPLFGSVGCQELLKALMTTATGADFALRLGHAPWLAGLAYGLYNLLPGLLSLHLGRWADRAGPRRVMGTGLGAMALGFVFGLVAATGGPPTRQSVTVRAATV